MSSVGVLAAPLASDGVRSRARAGRRRHDSTRVEPLFAEMEARGRAVLVASGCRTRSRTSAPSTCATSARASRSRVPVDGTGREELLAAFEARVRALVRPRGSGRAGRGDQLARLDSRDRTPTCAWSRRRRTDAARRGAEGHARRVVRRRLRRDADLRPLPRWGRARGSTGPAIVEERESTLVVGPGTTTLEVAADGA